MTPTTTFSMTPVNQPVNQPEWKPEWKKAVVTAGAGFLGSHLCERLLEAGVEVDCVDDLSSGSADNVGHLLDRSGFRFLEHDVSQPGCEEALPGPYDLVLHIACPASPAAALLRPLETLDAGSLGTRNLLSVADRDGARFLLAATSQVSGGPPDEAQRDDPWPAADPLDARTVYDESQRFSEALASAYVSAKEADAGIVRVFPAYGPRMSPDDQLIPTFIRQALNGEPVTVPGDGGQRPSLCYVDDAVDGVLLVAASRSVRPVDIGADQEKTIEEIARLVIDLTGSKARLEFGGTLVEGPAQRRPESGFARELFGWSPKVPWEEGLKRTIAHFLDRPGQGGLPTGLPTGLATSPGDEIRPGRTGGRRGVMNTDGGIRHACSW